MAGSLIKDAFRITTPMGFKACGVEAGIKRKDRKDVALIISDMPAAIAGTFTTNRVQAAPVILCKKYIASGEARAIIINSGNANACTGRQGMADAVAMAKTTAALLNVNQKSVFVCSTGTIGIPMPMQTVKKGIRLAVKNLSRNGGADAAISIMTTDTCPKEAGRRLLIDGREITIAGMAKGSGMIAPRMATMLAFLTTDASASSKDLQACLSTAVERSFNKVIVDGDQSTNDTVLFMANGAAGGRTLTPRHRDWKRFCSAVNETAMDLAMMIAKDGEGATKLVSVTVKGADSSKDAERAARTIACSPLVKTSWYGADPNWGRVICALGYSGAKIKPEKIDISLNGKFMVRKGQSAGAKEDALRKMMMMPELAIEADLHIGKAACTIYTCDFSENYIKINASYMT